MLKTIYKWYCDACGKELKSEYRGGRIEIKQYREEDDDDLTTVGMDFCKDCMISFKDWKKSRERIKP